MFDFLKSTFIWGTLWAPSTLNNILLSWQYLPISSISLTSPMTLLIWAKLITFVLFVTHFLILSNDKVTFEYGLKDDEK